MQLTYSQYFKLTQHILQVVRANKWDCTQSHVANLLQAMWLAQQPMYRTAYYNFCCFLTRFHTLYHKSYLTYIGEIMPHIKLTTMCANNVAIWGLESYYYTSPDIETLAADDLYVSSLDYKYVLPYNKYIFRADLLGYMVLWSDIERVRQKKYNEYVRTHYLLNKSSKKYARISCLAVNNYRTNNANLHRGIYPLLRTKHPAIHIKQAELISFVQQAILGGHRILIMKLSNEGAAPPISLAIGEKVAQVICNYYQNTPSFAQRWLTKQLEYNHLLNNRVLRSLWLGDSHLDFDYMIRTYAHYFPSQMRLDLLAYIDYPILSSLTHRIYSQLITLHGGMLHRREVCTVINHNVTLSYLTYTGMSMLCEQVPSLYHWSHRFLHGIMSSKVINAQPLFWVNGTWLRWEKKKVPRVKDWTDSKLAYASTLTVNYLLWGNYYKISNYLSQIWVGNNYFYLRSFNYSILNRAHYGRLHWKELLFSMDIDKFILLQLGKISEMIVKVWTNLGYTKFTDQLSGVVAAHEGVHRGLTHFSLGYINWCDEYSYITYHSLPLLVTQMQETLPLLHARSVHSILRRHMGIRRYMLGYRTKWYNYRRHAYDYGLGTCIHSINPISHYLWLEHVNWMRIIGLKREQLPYYNYNQQEDYLIPLSKKTPLIYYDAGVFALDTPMGVANPRSYPHIDKLTMLYTTL